MPGRKLLSMELRKGAMVLPSSFSKSALDLASFRQQ
jgi:hypothetical protein